MLMTWSESRIRGVMLAIATVLTLVLFWPAFKFAWTKWGSDPNYGHAYFVPLAAGFLVWRKRSLLRTCARKPSVVGLGLVVPAVVLHVLANNASLLRLSLVSFDVAVAGLIVMFLGWALLRQVAFPLVFLLLAVPIPLYLESTTLPMKVAASATAVQILSALGQSVYREGTIIHLSNLSLEVATACSGIRSLVLVCTVGAFYGYVSQASNLRRWVVFLASVPIALGANVARIVATAALSNYASSESLREIVHDFSGGFVFVVAGVLFVFTGMIVDAFSGYLLARKGRVAVNGVDVTGAAPSETDGGRM
jgi:exosortase